MKVANKIFVEGIAVGKNTQTVALNPNHKLVSILYEKHLGITLNVSSIAEKRYFLRDFPLGAGTGEIMVNDVLPGDNIHISHDSEFPINLAFVYHIGVTLC